MDRINQSNYTIVEDIFDDGEALFPETRVMRNTRGVGKPNERPDIPEPVFHERRKMNDAPQMEMFSPYTPEIQCKQVFSHIENCAICSGYLKKDVKFYWFVIFVLVMVILFLTRK
jgi:hypothetical protein